MAVMRRARRNLFLLRRLKTFGMGPQILKRFYSCTIESITAQYSNCKALQRVVRTAQYITGAKLLAIQDIQCLAKVFGPLELCDLLPHFRLQT